MEVNNTAYNTRKQKWFIEHLDKKVFEPTLEEVQKEITLNEWLFYFVSRITMTPHERYFETLAVGGTEEESQEEKNKTASDILNDYQDYPDYDKVLSVRTEWV